MLLAIKMMIHYLFEHWSTKKNCHSHTNDAKNWKARPQITNRLSNNTCSNIKLFHSRNLSITKFCIVTISFMERELAGKPYYNDGMSMDLHDVFA